MSDAKGAERGEFYGYKYYLDQDNRFLGEDVCNSGVYYVFESYDAFAAAVSQYNVLGRPRVRDAATGRA